MDLLDISHLTFWAISMMVCISREITKEIGDVDTILREGRIGEITKWLNEKIHQ